MAVGTFHSWQEPPGIAVAAGVPEHFVVALLPKDPEQPEGQEPPGIAAAVAVAPVPEQGRRRTDQRYSQMPSTPWPGEERELEHPTAMLLVVVAAVAVGAPQFQRMDWRVESPLPIAAAAAAAAAEAAVHIAAAGAVAAAAAGTGVADTAAGAVADADADTAVLDCRQEAWQS